MEQGDYDHVSHGIQIDDEKWVDISPTEKDHVKQAKHWQATW